MTCERADRFRGFACRQNDGIALFSQFVEGASVWLVKRTVGLIRLTLGVVANAVGMRRRRSGIKMTSGSAKSCANEFQADDNG
jgi:hypothetical protein